MKKLSLLSATIGLLFIHNTALATTAGDFGIALKFSQDNYGTSSSEKTTSTVYDADGNRLPDLDEVSKSGKNKIKNKGGLEISGNYFVVDNIAVAASLALPKKTNINTKDTGDSKWKKLGSVKNTQFGLTGQYHFNQIPQITPYVGAGINFMKFSNLKFNDKDLSGKTSNSTALLLQVGANYSLTDNLLLNVELKKAFNEFKLNVNDSEKDFDDDTDPDSDYTLYSYKDKVKIQPLTISLGVGYKF